MEYRLIKIIDLTMNKAKSILLTAVLALLPLSTVLAGGWVAPANKPNGVPEDLDKTILSATNWILGLISLIAVLAIIWGGVQYLTSAGNEDTMRTAKKTITYAIIGLVVAGIAYSIVNVLITTVITDGGAAAGDAANTNTVSGGM
ncbi:MAG: pilin [Candidatus Paceibacterota bacterium]|jgi:uncharacterized membrane protein